jgi:hypothetical protein
MILMADRERCVFTASGQIEAEQVRAFLESSGIPSVLRGESLTKTHGVTVSELGRVEVFVSETDADRANELLASVERGELRLADEDDLDES